MDFFQAHILVSVYWLYGIIHCSNADEVESIADVNKVLGRVLDEVAHLRLENKNMKSDNNYLQIKLIKLDNSQTEMLHKFCNVEKSNKNLHEEEQRLSVQNKILNNLVRRQCRERNYKDKDPNTLLKKLDKCPPRNLSNSFPANIATRSRYALRERKSPIEEFSKRLLLDIPTTNIVAFSVVLNHQVTLAPLQIVKYNKILTNVGNAYDPRIGHANIPIKGIYLVAVTILNHIHEDIHMQLVRNDDLQGSLYLPSGLSYGSMSQTLVLSLEKNDLVWVRVFKNNIYVGHRLFGKPNELYNTFSAILLFPL